MSHETLIFENLSERSLTSWRVAFGQPDEYGEWAFRVVLSLLI
jgi:hypothetical protein